MNQTNLYILNSYITVLNHSFNSLIAHLLKGNILRLIEVVIEQDADILGKLYANTPQHIKLNNEVGIDWVRRNFQNFPTVVEPNLSL
jgi:hypothetical protein